MAEAVIEPTPCVWMGRHSKLPRRVEGYQIGWAFYVKDGWAGGELSDKYLANPYRDPIVVVIPAPMADGGVRGTCFCIDDHESSGTAGWDVTVDMDSLVIGQKPIITVSPSIHAVGIWHGWLQDGVLHQ